MFFVFVCFFVFLRVKYTNSECCHVTDFHFASFKGFKCLFCKIEGYGTCLPSIKARLNHKPKTNIDSASLFFVFFFLFFVCFFCFCCFFVFLFLVLNFNLYCSQSTSAERRFANMVDCHLSLLLFFVVETSFFLIFVFLFLFFFFFVFCFFVFG